MTNSQVFFHALLLLLFHSALSTIDLTLPEFQHLANHLTKDECHKLIASLYFDSFKINKNVENAENAVPEDVGCLKLLLKWNSTPLQGRGVTHEKLSLRLRQIGRRDLSEWLDTAVLQELEEAINKTAEEFKEYPGETDQNAGAVYEDENLEAEFSSDDSSWDAMQATLVVLFVITASITVFLVLSKIVQSYRMSKVDVKAEVEMRKRGSKLYEKFQP